MTAERPKKPKLFVLEAITPSVGTSFADRLEYSNLQKRVNENAPFESRRSEDFWNAEPDSLDELSAAKGLASQYMLMGSLALQQAGSAKNKELWSERYTQATSEIYGIPDSVIARRLWDMQQSDEVFATESTLEHAATSVKKYMASKYEQVYEALESDMTEQLLDPTEVAQRFDAALTVLTEEYDEDWADWVVERNEEKDSLSVVAVQKKIIVGMQRANMPANRLKGLFSHEVLVHGLRAVNGRKLSEGLETGLSGYLDAEEGLGVFVEYAESGKISDKIIDKYVDIAYALGQIDGRQHTRAELLGHAMNRAEMRNQTSIDKTSPEDMRKEVYAHVNRIYRGSLGDEYVGIFTKDIAYFKGFLSMGEYISDQLAGGREIEETMDFLMAGKFDPTIESHVGVVERLTTA